MALRDFLIRRLITGFITLMFVLVLNFFIFWLMPGDPVMLLVAGNPWLKEERKNALIHELGLDRPLHEQLLMYFKNVFTMNFGISFVHNRPVSELIFEALPYTLVLLVPAVIGAIWLGMKLGAISAWEYGSKFDVSTLVIALVFYSMPVFWLGMFMILVFGYWLKWFPVAGVLSEKWLSMEPWQDPIGFVLDVIWHMVLPVVTLILYLFGGYYLIMRNTMLDTLMEDYIITAKAKGCPDDVIIYKHARRNAMLPMITIIALAIAGIFSGAVLTETIFSWPGMGRLIFEATLHQDFPVLWGTFTVMAILVVIANIIADIIYAFLDPRIRY